MRGGRSATSSWSALGAVVAGAVAVVVAAPVVVVGLVSSTSVVTGSAGWPSESAAEATSLETGPLAVLPVEPQRSTGRAGGPTGGSADDFSRRSIAPVPLAARLAPAPRCPWTDADRALVGAERHQRIVEFAYCSLLGRAPDADGLTYWRGQIGAGLSVGDLVVQVTGSVEYRRGRPGRDRWEDSPLGALTALLPASGAGPATPSTTQGTRPPVRNPAGDGLRERQLISVGEFERWIADRGLTDVDRVTDALVHGRLSGDRQAINVAYVHRSVTRNLRVSPRDRGRATVGTWGREIGADVAINGNWYGPWDGPAVSQGEVYGGSDHGYTALFGVTAGGDAVLEHHREINEGVDPRVVDGVSGHPTLVHRGQRTIDFGTDPTFLNRNPRTVIGLDATGDILILVTVDGRSTRARGMTGDETARLMERLGAHDALMLDGGGSTTMWIAGRGVVNRPSGPLRAVGNQLAAFGS